MTKSKKSNDKKMIILYIITCNKEPMFAYESEEKAKEELKNKKAFAEEFTWELSQCAFNFSKIFLEEMNKYFKK